MKTLIPNHQQEKLIQSQYEMALPRKKITILSTGLVVVRRPKSGSKMVGQVVKTQGMFICYTMRGQDHRCIYQGPIEEPETEIEALKRRVSQLENML